ncbi:MAG: trehalose-6-phosphate synthase [Anaerolineales bacterium]|nr:trehalose-6-phosphate synthase [Anaerolineales bacterium]
MKEQKLLTIIASNRGPFKFIARRDGSFGIDRGAGGLITALGPLAERNEVLWVALALSRGDRKWATIQKDKAKKVEGISLRLINTSKQQYDAYYNIIANPLLWFLQHQIWDISRSPSITKETWQAWENGYIEINRLFADAIKDSIKDIEQPVIVMPQDYHLYLLPDFLRERLGSKVQIQPFIHIPWPGPDAWRLLPKGIRAKIFKGLLASDRIGFQTKKDAFNFVQTCRFYLPEAKSHGSRDTIFFQDRVVEAKAYPISIDVENIQKIIGKPQTHFQKKELINIVGDRKLILRVDRIEPSKNILRGLMSYRSLLEAYPEHRGKVQMIALLVPSRLEVTEYQDYLREIMAEGGMINAQYGNGFWEPIRIIVGDNYSRAIAAMQIYDVLLVNPISDGMNLVAKEGPLVNTKDGVLVLSEHAGAFYELGDYALSVSPFDTYGTAEALHRALIMPEDDRSSRSNMMKEVIRKADVRWWFHNQVEDTLRAINNQESNTSTSAISDAKKSEAPSTD